jgi:dihydroorotate dehydrogenase (NAD+) catalytic subunit
MSVDRSDPASRSVERSDPPSRSVELSIDVGALRLKNPVLTASGTFGYALEYDGFFDVAELGGICTKGLSLEPRPGNAPDRICETAAGMLNAIGLANVGVEAFCRDKLPELRRRGVTVVANVFATTVEDFVKLAQRIERDTGVAAIELNVSCPNVDKGGLEFGCDPVAAARVTAAVRAVTKLPLWVKMSPEAGDLKRVAQACEEAGADALTAINTIRGLAIDPRSGKARLANRTGGLSGPALKPIALRMVWELARAVKIPIVGIGGIATADDAIEFLYAGATAIQVGTANFADPLASKKVKDGLAAYCEARGLTPRDLVGKLA